MLRYTSLMDYFPTGGELATKCLDAFSELKTGIEDGVVSAEDESTLRLTNEFVVAALGLMRKMPGGSRESFGQTLPFNGFELGLLGAINLQEHSPVLVAVTNRFWDWISFGSLYTNRQVTCAAFLRQLTPFLDLWEERTKTQELAAEFEASDTVDVFTSSRHGPIRDI
jgi:hypothetical protein